MFESLKKAIDEIFGSVIRPIKEWILRQSWGVRVVCLIVIALAAFAWWKPQTVGGFYQQGTFYWRSWRSGSDKVPLSGPAQRSLALAIERVAPSVEADLDTRGSQTSPLTPWSASQLVLALRSAGRDIADKPGYVTFVNHGRFSPDCFCWTELEEQPKSEVVGYVGAWVMAAFADIGQPLTTADLDYLLNQQNAGGWWPMFPESGAAAYSSSYTTAWMTLGLHKQRVAGLIPAERRAAVDRAIFRASIWLMRSRRGARWTAHQGAPNSDTPEALSGFVLHVLHQVGAADLADLDRAWLDSLPTHDLEPTSLEKHYMVLPYGRRSQIDHIVEIRLPWILLGTADAYASGTAAQKARALNWIEQVLRDPSVRSADTQGFDWVRAELLLGLTETSKRADCPACQTNASGARQGQ